MKTLRARVAVLPLEKQRATGAIYAKAVFWLMTFFGAFTALFFVENTVASLALCVLIGLAIAAIGFNIFHDSIHGSLSHKRWVNRFWAFVSCTALGAGHFGWRHKHNYLHHMFPNMEGIDDDLETRGGLRLSQHQPYLARYQFQHIYAPLVYAMTSIEWVFVRDYIRYFSGSINPLQKLPPMKTSDHVEFWSSKILYLAFAVALPLFYFSSLEYLAGFAVVHLVTSVTLAAIFQLAHVAEPSAFPLPEGSGNHLKMEWPELQLATTVDFGTRNRILSWYCGGLNYQVEHHLLPGVSHAHYPTVGPIVERTSREFGYPYYSLPTYWDALVSHYRMLKRFGRAEVGEPVTAK
jgi:linoleoyl-CoA desaturase